MSEDAWASERKDVLDRFAQELAKATGDGSRKRQSGEKPPWYRDDAHEAAIFSHLMKWKRGELSDPDSGAHPLVHAAWRCLAIACRETGNTPESASVIDAEGDTWVMCADGFYRLDWTADREHVCGRTLAYITLNYGLKETS